MDIKDAIFGDLDDDLDAAINAPKGEPRQSSNPGYTKPTYTEPCRKCGGSGRWGYGKCFGCQGRGTQTFKTSGAQRASARASRERVKADKVAEQRVWREAHKPELEWLTRVANREETKMGVPPFKYWPFPIELRNKLSTYGILTDGQIGAIRKCMAKEAERAVERKEREATATVVDISKLEAAFDVAKARASSAGAMGIKRLHLRLQSGGHSLSFSPGSPGSEWDGMVFVKEADKKLGWVKGGKFTRRFACTDEEEAAILDACADPLKAALAYGQKWSQCAVCGRELTNDESIERGIGPVCAENYGW